MSFHPIQHLVNCKENRFICYLYLCLNYDVEYGVQNCVSRTILGSNFPKHLILCCKFWGQLYPQLVSETQAERMKADMFVFCNSSVLAVSRIMSKAILFHLAWHLMQPIILIKRRWLFRERIIWHLFHFKCYNHLQDFEIF